MQLPPVSKATVSVAVADGQSTVLLAYSLNTRKRQCLSSSSGQRITLY